MRLIFLSVKSGRVAWSEAALEEYHKKIAGFCKFELEEIKSKSHPRNKSNEKSKEEGQQILKKIDKADFVVAFDENGARFRDSEEFSAKLQGWLELGKSRIVFVLGGAYGLSDEVKERANALVSLSQLTMNHHVARVVALEQIYRSFTLAKGIPYHND